LRLKTPPLLGPFPHLRGGAAAGRRIGIGEREQIAGERDQTLLARALEIWKSARLDIFTLNILSASLTEYLPK
jgi:hypothetical protein